MKQIVEYVAGEHVDLFVLENDPEEHMKNAAGADRRKGHKYCRWMQTQSILGMKPPRRTCWRSCWLLAGSSPTGGSLSLWGAITWCIAIIAAG